MKNGVTGPLATKRYAQPKKQLYKMMLQVPHTYPGGAYKKRLAFLFLTLKPNACTTKISPRLFVVSASLVSDHLCSITVLNFFVPQEPFCRQASVAQWMLVYPNLRALEQISVLSNADKTSLSSHSFVCEDSLG